MTSFHEFRMTLWVEAAMRWLGQGSLRRALGRRPRYRPRLQLELLEDRLAPANTINIVNGGLAVIPAGAMSFADTSNISIDPAAFTGVGSVTLQANVDIDVSNALPTLASGQNLTFQAGRSISIGGAITGSNAVFSFTVNDPGADQAQRTAGDAALSLQTGISMTNTGGSVDFIGGTGDSATADTHPNGAIALLNGASVSASGGITMTGRSNAANPDGIVVRGTVNGNGGPVSLSGSSIVLGSAGQLLSNGGTISLSTTAGGSVELVGGLAGLDTTQGGGNGNITIGADNISISDPIKAGTGTVTIHQATAATHNITLGNGAAGLGLSDAELGKITAGDLVIGRLDNPGNINLDGPVTKHAGYDQLSLLSGGTITQQPAAPLAVTNLYADGAGGVTLTNSANAVTNLSGSSNSLNTFFNTGAPDGRMATASRPDAPAAPEIESADDFILNTATQVGGASFTGLLPAGVPLSSVSDVVVEVYRVFPKDSTSPPDGQVPSRVNSPSDNVFASRASNTGDLSFTPVVLAASFTASNSVLNGINPIPNQTTGGEGAVTGQEVQFNVLFNNPFNLPADHYFFIPQVRLDNGNFLWLSVPKPITGGTGPFTGDLQEWIRNAALDPNWLRVGTDIVGGTVPPTFNASFSLANETPSAASFSFTDSTPLTIGTVEGFSGINTTGAIDLISPFVYDANARTLVVNATAAQPTFTFSQQTTGPNGGTQSSLYTFTLSGTGAPTTMTFTDAQLTTTPAAGTSAVTVNGQNLNTANAVISTNDLLAGATGETPETITLGSKTDAGVGSVTKYVGNVTTGAAYSFLSLHQYPISYAYAGRADGTIQLFGTQGTGAAGFVSAGYYSYISAATTGSYAHFAEGTPSVYGYSAGNASDFSYAYSMNAGSSYLVSGTAFSYMSGSQKNPLNANATDTFFNVGVGFLVNTGVSNNPGKDIAYIIDSLGNDTYSGQTGFSFMSISNGAGGFSEFDAAFGFALYFAESFVGGTDTGNKNAPANNIYSSKWVLV
jgi:hypothetical protein